MRPERRSGSALLAAIMFVMLFTGLGLSVLQVNLQVSRQRSDVGSDQRAFYAAEAAIHEAWVGLCSRDLDPLVGDVVTLGTAANPRDLANVEYWATVTRLDTRRYSVVASARDGRGVKSQEVILSAAPVGFFQYAAFGGTGVGLDSNAFIDSYDSLLGDYASQIGASGTHADQNAVVGSNDDILLGSNTQIYGDCRPGPGGRLDASRPGTLVTGATDPADTLVDLPPIEFPRLFSLGSRTISTDVVLGPGEIRFDSVKVDAGATVTIVGPATIVFDSYHMLSGTAIEFQPALGPIEVYAANDFVLESNTRVVTHSDAATDVKLFLAGETTTRRGGDRVELSSNSQFVGAIYAPNATVSLGSNFEIFGSVMAGGLDLSSNGMIHFDEALLYDTDGAMRPLVQLAWRRRAAEPAP